MNTEDVYSETTDDEPRSEDGGGKDEGSDDEGSDDEGSGDQGSRDESEATSGDGLAHSSAHDVSYAPPSRPRQEPPELEGNTTGDTLSKC